MKNSEGKQLKNLAHAKATYIDASTNEGEAKARLKVVDKSEGADFPGDYIFPFHSGPLNEKGVISKDPDNYNPKPTVYDDALLGFESSLGAFLEGMFNDFDEYIYAYEIDPNLILDGIATPGLFKYLPYYSYYSDEEHNDFYGIDAAGEKKAKNPNAFQDLPEEPVFDIYANVNGERKLLVKEAEHGKYYTREELGLSPEEKVSNIEYDFSVAPAGLYAGLSPRYYFSIEPGYVGEVENYWTARGVGGFQYDVGQDIHGNPAMKPKEDEKGNILPAHEPFNYDSRDWDFIPGTGPTQAIVEKKPENSFPITTVGVSLKDHSKGNVVYGPNRMEVSLDNRSTSAYAMKESLESVVLLPLGVKVSEKANDKYSNEKGGTYKVIDDYEGTGRQLVKFTWNDKQLYAQESLKASIDVEIKKSNSSVLKFDVYGFSGDKELRVPLVNGESITDTILQTDADDLNGDGIKDQPRIKSGNIYTIRGSHDLQSEKFVKGQLDKEWNKFGKTIPGGSIDYKLHLTNTSGKDLSKMTLIDVLPSEEDLGITDNVARDSKFTPTMKGPIKLPKAWEGKVNVFYSESKNPKRDDLVRHTDYPETTQKLSNPANAEDPKWKEESGVADWSKIYSFKIELIDGETFISGTDMDVVFSMKAPEGNKVDKSLLDKNVEPSERAAYNSFAVATENSQPVEPKEVGVYMDAISIDVEKIWESDDSSNVEVPKEIKVDLLQNGEVIDTVIITKENDWKHTFINLDEFGKDGNKYVYTVKEHDVDGFVSEVTGDSKEGFTITNTPEEPPTTPEIDKDVEGKDHLDIDYNKEYKYNIVTKLPNNIDEYDKFEITDKVDKGLVVIEDKVKVTVDGKEHAAVKLEVDGNNVKVSVTDFESLKGQGQIELVIPAKIHPDTNIEDYKDNKIPNTANLDFTNESGTDENIPTDPVTVTPPTPEEPPVTPPTPEEPPVTPPTPEEPSVTPPTPEDPPEEFGPKEPGKFLPKTATVVYTIMFLGAMSLLLGALLLLLKRRTQEEN